jgi:hypothetical protein
VAKIRCPNGHRLRVSESLVGKKGKCPECGASFLIDAEPSVDPDSPQSAFRSCDTPPRPPKSRQRERLRSVSTRSPRPGLWTLLPATLIGVLTLSAVIGVGLYFSLGSGSGQPGKPDNTITTSEAPKSESNVPKEAGPAAVSQIASTSSAEGTSETRSRGKSRIGKPGLLTSDELDQTRKDSKIPPMVGRAQDAKGRTFGPPRIVTTTVQLTDLDQPPTAAQIADVHRAIREGIAALEAGDVIKFYEDYGPIDQFRALRDSGRLKSMRSSSVATQSLIATLKLFCEGKIRVDRDGLLARVTPSSDDPGAADAGESPNASAAVPSPKDDKVSLVGYGDDLPQVLHAGLAALEAGQIESFIDHLFPAGELGRLQADGKAKLVARLKKQPELIEQMRRDLKAAGNAPVEFNTEKTLASITLPAPSDHPEEAPRIVKFQKIAVSWRFFDNSTRVRDEIVRLSRLVPPKLSYPVVPGDGDRHALLMEKLGTSWRISRMPRP